MTHVAKNRGKLTNYECNYNYTEIYNFAKFNKD